MLMPEQLEKYIKLKPNFSINLIGATKNPELKAAKTAHIALCKFQKLIESLN